MSGLGTLGPVHPENSWEATAITAMHDHLIDAGVLLARIHGIPVMQDDRIEIIEDIPEWAELPRPKHIPGVLSERIVELFRERTPRGLEVAVGYDFKTHTLYIKPQGRL